MLNSTRSLLLGTRNTGKIHEIKLILGDVALGDVALGDVALELCSLNDFPNVAVAEENADTYAGNAILKAQFYARETGIPALADDSGLEVEALAGAPGVQSARYAGEPKSDARNNEKLIAALDGVADRSAHYACVLTLLRHEYDPEPIVAEGTWHGTVIDTPRGSGGFGYDPYFLDAATGLTAAELPLERKNELSHRGKAIRALIARLAALASDSPLGRNGDGDHDR